MRLTPLAGLALIFAASCTDDVQERLSEPLKQQGVKTVVVDEAKITATCALGAQVKIPSEELERNFLGMAKTSKVAAIAKNILRACDDKDTAQRQEEAVAAKITEETARLGIATAGMDVAATKQAICQKLTAALPVKDPDRTMEGAKNTQRWGCEAPPLPAALPTGAWAVEIGKQVGKKPAQSFLRLQNEAGEKLTFRCVGKKADLYLQASVPAKKGTKAIDARIDGSKPAKWKVKPSTDGKAMFFVDVKGAFKALAGANEVAFSIPAKKPAMATFATKGIGEALLQMPKPCQQ